MDDRPELRLFPARPEDEQVATAAHRDDRWPPFTFLHGYDPAVPWSSYVGWLDGNRRRTSSVEGRVPATFLLAWVDGDLVGRASIRHQLNEELAAWHGHIGYGVLPEHRRRGYATEILRQGLVIARSEGVTDVLVTCDEDNLGSARTIERCGGQLESIVQPPDGEPRKRRYWIR